MDAFSIDNNAQSAQGIWGIRVWFISNVCALAHPPDGPLAVSVTWSTTCHANMLASFHIAIGLQSPTIH